MAKKKYYAVRKGRSVGIFDTWDECKAQVTGYSSAEYKSFTNIDDAKAFIDGETSEAQIDDTGDVEVKEGQTLIRAYVDVSLDRRTRRYAGGVVILVGDEEIEISEMGNDKTLVSMHNVAGELLGAIKAMEWVANSGIENPQLVIYHDYEGIHKWASGDWKANKEGTQSYVKTYNRYASIFDIRFVKVKAHSGDKYNEIADQLAKKALDLI